MCARGCLRSVKNEIQLIEIKQRCEIIFRCEFKNDLLTFLLVIDVRSSENMYEMSPNSLINVENGFCRAVEGFVRIFRDRSLRLSTHCSKYNILK